MGIPPFLWLAYSKSRGIAIEARVLILEGNRGERKAVKLVKTHLSTKFLVVVYRDEKSRKAIITAYFTSDLTKEGSDVLYISVDKPREADDSFEPQEGIVMRSRKGELVGITIIKLRKRFAEPGAKNSSSKR